jgi:hypothetical protein
VPDKPYDINVHRSESRPIVITHTGGGPNGRVALWLDVPLAEGLIVDLGKAIERVKHPPEPES